MTNYLDRAVALTVAALFLQAAPLMAGESVKNTQLGYSAYFPSQKDPQTKLPVLVTLPAYGMTADQEADFWTFPAEKHGLVTVSVDMNYDRLTRIGDAQRRIEAILEEIGRTRPIDPSRVVIAGTAAGGMVAISLGLNYPERYDAVAVAGGGTLKSLDWAGVTNARKQNFFMIHGGLNKFVPVLEFNETVKNLKQYGGRVKSRIFEDADHTLPTHAYSDLITDLNAVLMEKK